MSNMSYCRFQNTLSDLNDCHRALRYPEDDLTGDEEEARLELIQTCVAIALRYGKEVGQPVELIDGE